ncbi:MAG: FliM/FliN family flagellar motor switch protein [Polyangiales bacterium]
MSVDGIEPLLSLEETNALLDAMRSGTEDTSVEPLDLTSAERPLREALTTADNCARSLAEALDKLMLRTTGCSSSTEELPAEIVPYKVMRGAIPQGAAILPFRSNDGSPGVLTIGSALVSFILDRRMGAPLGRDLPSEPRSLLSPLDRRLLEPFASSVSELFAKHWCNDPKAFPNGNVLAQPADMPILPQFEPLLQLVFRVTPTGVAGDQITLALSSGIVSRARPASPTIEVKRLPNPVDRERMEAALRGTDVEVIALLGKQRATVREVLALRAGDVVRLENTPEEALDLRVGPRPVFRGTPLVQRGNLAMQVTQLLGVQQGQ